MAEFASHIGWLQSVEQEMAQSTNIQTDTRRNSWLVTCQQVIDENPHNQTAQRILAILEPSPEIVDIVTGETVVNIPYSHGLGLTRDMYEHDIRGAFLAAKQQTQSGDTADISRAVSLVSNVGPFIGFGEMLLTEGERSRLNAADHALCAKCAQQLERLMLAAFVEDLMPKLDQAIERHVTPLVDRIAEERIRENVTNVLDIWNTNRQNPRRNNYKKAMSALSPNNTDRYTRVPAEFRENPAYFGIGYLSYNVTENARAAYSHPYNVLRFDQLITRTKQQADLMDALSVVHEVTHKQQQMREFQRAQERGITPEQWHRQECDRLSSSPSNSAILEDECESSLNEVVLFNAAVQPVLQGGSVNLADIGVDDSALSRKQMEHMFSLHAAYYGGRKEAGSEEKFRQLIFSIYSKVGPVYTRDAEGQLHEVTAP